MADQHHIAQVEEVPDVPAYKGGGGLDSTTGVGRSLHCVLDLLKLIFYPLTSLSEMLSRLTAMSYGVALTISMLLGLLVVYADGMRGFSLLLWIIILITSDGLLRGMAVLNLIILLLPSRSQGTY